MTLWDRLRQRRIVQRAIAYLAVAWALLEALGFLTENFAWHPAIPRAAVVLLATGFVVAMILAWYHGEKGHQRAPAREIVLLALTAFIGIAATGSVVVRTPTAASGTAAQPPHDNELKDGWVAVLPFANLSSDTSQNYFAAGITQEITTALGRLRDLRVISPGSTLPFRERTGTALDEIGRRLGVATLVDGSVRMAGSLVRVNAQVVSARTGEQLWTDQYEGELTASAVFGIQSDIAASIAGALESGPPASGAVPPADVTAGAAASPAWPRRSLQRPTESLEAHNAYLQGLHAFHSTGPAGVRAAVSGFERAIELDPDFALAHAALAEAWLAYAHFGMPPHTAFPNGRRHAERALEIEPGIGDAHITLADILFHYEWDWEGAEREFLRGQQLGSAFSTAHWWYAGLLSALGRHEEAIRQVEFARELDPLSPMVHIFAGQVYGYARRYDEAEDALTRAIELNPGAAYGHATLAMVRRGQGRLDEAVVAAREAARLAPGPHLGLLAAILAEGGYPGEARDALSQAETIAAASTPQRYVPPYTMAPGYLALGQVDRALDLLDRGAELRDAALIWVNVNPLFDPLRPHPRFRGLIARLGLTP